MYFQVDESAIFQLCTAGTVVILLIVGYKRSYLNTIKIIVLLVMLSIGAVIKVR